MKLKASALYRDAEAPIPARVQDLLGRMTIEEKVAQLLELWGGRGIFNKLLGCPTSRLGTSRVRV